MLYIVSGFLRSGTSMMMDALSAGGRPHGLRVEWSRERDAAMAAKHGVFPNESYREISLQEYSQFDFPLRYDGCLIKVMSWGLASMRRCPHRIVFMLRDPAEIAESMERSFGQGPALVVDGIQQTASQNPMAWAAAYDRQMKQAAAKAAGEREKAGKAERHRA